MLLADFPWVFLVIAAFVVIARIGNVSKNPDSAAPEGLSPELKDSLAELKRAGQSASRRGTALKVQRRATATKLPSRARTPAAERPVREDESIEQLSAAQIARRADRTNAAIGDDAGHEAWHAREAKIDAAQQHGRTRAPHPVFARLAAMGPGGAIVLGEILGKPKSLS